MSCPFSLRAPCNKGCIFPNPNPVSVDQLYCVGGSAGKSGLVTLIRLRKCYPNSQHLLFDLFCGRLSLSLRFPYFTKSNTFSNFVFQKIFKSKSTKEYKNCYPGHSGWTGNFLSCFLSLSLYVSVYVWRCTRVSMYGQACAHVDVCAYVSVCIRAYVCACVYTCMFLCFGICVYMGVYLCMPLCVLCVYVSVCVCVCVGIVCTSEYMWMCVYFGLSDSGVNY